MKIRKRRQKNEQDRYSTHRGCNCSRVSSCGNIDGWVLSGCNRQYRGLISVVLLIISRLQLGKSFSVMPQARTLVATGLYSKIQHPMYVFLDLFFVSLIVAFDLPILIFAWGIVVIVQTVQADRRNEYSRPPLALNTRPTEIKHGFNRQVPDSHCDPDVFYREKQFLSFACIHQIVPQYGMPYSGTSSLHSSQWV